MSELHNRLAHLVNYSSQLIFVSGNSIADQQRTLNNFLADQQENTEISYFTADANKTHQEYRGAICRQLAGHTVGSFIRPLVQLLNEPNSGLNPQQGPYLVCITQADQLDQSFLQELWDWVMHTQQGDEKLHLNVILFGETSWANEAQEWLPMQNSHKPVLLSSESIDPTGFDVNALEALMADKQSWLSASNQPLVTNKWFIGSVLSVFFVIFVGLMAWQYPQQIMHMFESDTAIAQVQNEAPDFEQVSKNEGINLSDTSQTDLPLSEAVTTENDVPSVTDSLLVSKWEHEKTQEDVPSVEKTKIQANIDEAAPTIAKSTNETEVDFQVPDIISVEELDAQLDDNIEQKPLLARVDNVQKAPVAQDSKPSIEIKQTLDSPGYKFDESTLLSLPTDAIVLQLSGIQNPVVLENYLNSNNLKANTWVYETQRYGGPWYVVLYKQSFDSIDAALSQMTQLPDDVKEAQPFAKSINQIKQEISRR